MQKSLINFVVSLDMLNLLLLVAIVLDSKHNLGYLWFYYKKLGVLKKAATRPTPTNDLQPALVKPKKWGFVGHAWVFYADVAGGNLQTRTRTRI